MAHQTFAQDAAEASLLSPPRIDDCSWYAQAFCRYTAHTNGKDLLARSLIRQLPMLAASNFLLDCGAGDGALTAKLAPLFRRVVAVEKNPAFAAHLSRIPNCTVELRRMEDYFPKESPDIILLSYALTGVNAAQTGGFLRDMLASRSPRGRMLLCTYDDLSPWAQFADKLLDRFGASLRGGDGDYLTMLDEHGLPAVEIERVPTQIWGSDLEDLADNLSVLFAERRQEYEHRRPEVISLLKNYAKRHEYLERVEIEVRECVFEVPGLKIR